MTSNTYDITIDAPIEHVWRALTIDAASGGWMQNVKVETDWQAGSPITYTCYDADGAVMEWNGMRMVWRGVITALQPPRVFTCTYPPEETGLAEESYQLETTPDGTTHVHFDQTCTDAAAAAGYKEGTDETLRMLKQYAELDTADRQQ